MRDSACDLRYFACDVRDSACDLRNSGCVATAVLWLAIKSMLEGSRTVNAVCQFSRKETRDLRTKGKDSIWKSKSKNVEGKRCVNFQSSVF